VASARQAVRSGRGGVDDHGIQRLVRAARCRQECGMGAVITPGAR